MYLTIFQANSSCQDEALADLPDGVCVSEMWAQRNKCKTPLELELNVCYYSILFLLFLGNKICIL